MAFRVLVDPAAFVEAEEAFLWLLERSPRDAERWLHGLKRPGRREVEDR